MDKDDAHCQCNGLTFGDSEHQHSGQGTFASQDSALRFLRHLLLSLYSLGHGTWRHRQERGPFSHGSVHWQLRASFGAPCNGSLAMNLLHGCVANQEVYM
ncbi:hypothetical protein NC652_031353 [Populus alba x Populus x berolinensis]|nr:hypothetical protein NC652_031353 [Populus alba x Populus x berolinensis]